MADADEKEPSDNDKGVESLVDEASRLASSQELERWLTAFRERDELARGGLMDIRNIEHGKPGDARLDGGYAGSLGDAIGKRLRGAPQRGKDVRELIALVICVARLLQ